jgi:hypothetical protein
MLAGLYAGIRDKARLSSDYESWLAATEHLAGPLERKRKVDRDALGQKLGGASIRPGDMGPALLAIETYLALKAAASIYRAAVAIRKVPPDEASARLEDDLSALLSGQLALELGVDGAATISAYHWALSQAPARTRNLLREDLERPVEAHTTSSSDIFRFVYQDLVPKELRHTVGAYFTPQWLARYTIRSVAADPADNGFRLLDPTCGSGTFLLEALQILHCKVDADSISPDRALQQALNGIVGYELNPLTALFARANYLRSLVPLANRCDSLPRMLRVPVYVRDAVLPNDSQPPQSEALAETHRGDFDLVVGNPPWVNWEYLPPAYREEIAPLWPEFGLFDNKGRDRAFSKEDISVLVTYSAAGRYLRSGGTLAFLLPRSVVKSPLNARGFRRFQLGAAGEPLNVLRVDDLSALRVFGGSAGQTVLFTMEKGRPTSYPIPYRSWRPATKRSSIPEGSQLEDVLPLVKITEEVADVVDKSSPSSAWMTAPPHALEVLHRLSGTSPYRARTGLFTGGANGVFHVEVLEELSNGLLRIRNCIDRAKRAVPVVETEIEPTFVFPLLRGREVSAWTTSGSICTILPHTLETGMHPAAPEVLREVAPRTLAYLSNFRPILAERRGFGRWERQFLDTAFYACQRVGPYTFSEQKLVWRYIAPRFTAAVATGSEVRGELRPLIPNEKLMQIAVSTEIEAHYLCGLLMSAPARFFIESRMVGTQISPSVIAHLAIPPFDPAQPLHCTIAEGSKVLHGAPTEQLRRVVLRDIDESAAQLFELDEVHLAATQGLTTAG